MPILGDLYNCLLYTSLTLYMGEQERRFFHALCYAVGAEKALLQAVLRVCIWRGKGFIPYS